MRKTLICLLIGILCFEAQNTFSQVSNAPYTGMDVLFLINQSLTTNDVEGLGASDPNGVRFSSVQGAVNWLGVYRTQQHMLGNDLTFNVSSVYFGGIYFPGRVEVRNLSQAVETPLEWSQIMPESFDQWKDQQTPILEALSEHEFGPRHLGMRDYLIGLEEAFAQFENGGNPEHRQVIILITDGKPCAVQFEEYVDQNCTSTNVRGRYMSAVRTLVQRRFNEPNQSLHLLFLDPERSEWDQYNRLWTDVVRGNADPIYNPDDLNVTIHDILAEIIETDLPVFEGTTISAPVNLPQGAGLSVDAGAGNYVIPPYQEMLTLSLFKSNPNSRPVLLINDSEVRTADVFGVNGTVEIWSLRNPPPGNLTVSSQLIQGESTSADPAAVARIDLLPVRFDFDVPQIGLRRYVPVRFKLAAVDSVGEMLAIYPNETDQLDADVTIRPPTGAEFSLSLEPDFAANQYTGAFTPLETGVYTASLRAKAGSSLDLSPESVTFRVEPVIVEIDGMQREALEDIPQTYTLSFKSGQSVVPQLTPQIWVTTFIPEDVGECSDVNADSTLPDGAFRFDEFEVMDGGAVMTVLPEIPGDYHVCVTVTVRDPLTNDSIQVYNNASTSTVNLVNGLALLLTRPEVRASDMGAIRLPEETTLWTSILENTPDLPFELVRPYWERQSTPLQITVVEEVDAARTEGFTPVEIGQDIPADESEFFNLRVLNANNEQVAQNAQLTQTANPAVWSVDLPPLPAGTYTITIQTSSTPIGETNYAFLPQYAQFTQTLEIVPNLERPALLGLYSTLALLIVGLVVNFGLIRPTNVRRNRLRGVLYIEAQDDQTKTISVIDRLSLDSAGIRDQWVIPLVQLPLIDPPLTYLEVRMQRGKLQIYYGIQGGEPQPVELTDYRQPRNFGSSVYTPNRRFFFRWDAEGQYQPPTDGREDSAE